MDEGEINKQLRELVEQLKHENELLKSKVIDLEARLSQYEKHILHQVLDLAAIAKKIRIRTIRESLVKK